MSKKESLLRGVGVVIDDHVSDDTNDDIKRLIKNIEAKGFPLVKYDRIPLQANQIIANLGNVAFLVMDWEFQQTFLDRQEGVTINQELIGSKEKDVIRFIRQFRRSCIAPVFIFTNRGADADEISRKLGKSAAAGVMIKDKSEISSAVIKTMEEWLCKCPSSYVLKLWNNVYDDAQQQMFKDFYKKHEMWPIPLYWAYKHDDDDPRRALTELIMRNIAGRMRNMPLHEGYLKEDARLSIPKTLRSILELSAVVPVATDEKVSCGDLFVQRDGEGVLYQLNVRCDCDLYHSKKPELILLNGREVARRRILDGKLYSEDNGFERPLNGAYVFPINGGKCVCFKFKDFKRIKVSEVGTEKRIGRLLPPYITDIRQRHAQWLQREGFPKIPMQAFRR